MQRGPRGRLRSSSRSRPHVLSRSHLSLFCPCLPPLPLTHALPRLCTFLQLLEKVWDYCNMIRIYTKPKGQIPDYNEPVILHDTNPSLEMFCNRIHKDILPHLKYAWVWGSSVKHQPMKTGKDHRLNDEDVVQIVKKV
ncbi:unnamed protein product [Scytosiphon promiscuus]